jgi:hypothetical protein
MTFLMNTSETKKFVKIFGNFDLKKKFIQIHFYKRGFLNSQAVRIRVNDFSNGYPFEYKYVQQFLSCGVNPEVNFALSKIQGSNY